MKNIHDKTVKKQAINQEMPALLKRKSTNVSLGIIVSPVLSKFSKRQVLRNVSLFFNTIKNFHSSKDIVKEMKTSPKLGENIGRTYF